MKKCYIDANVLVYLLDKDSPFHDRVESFFKDAIEEKRRCFISPLAFDEFLHTMKNMLMRHKHADSVLWQKLREHLNPHFFSHFFHCFLCTLAGAGSALRKHLCHIFRRRFKLGAFFLNWRKHGYYCFY